MTKTPNNSGRSTPQYPAPRPQPQYPTRGPAPMPSPGVQARPASGAPRGRPWRSADWFLLPLRLFLGITFIYAGIQKLTDPQYFNPKAVGYIGKQIIGFASGSPIHDFLIRVAVPHAMAFGALVAFGELAIGLGALFGVLLRPAAFFGMLISVVFFLSASWKVRPYFYGADIVFIFAWLTIFLAGPVASWLPTFDAAFVRWLLARLAPERRPLVARACNLLLGVRDPEAASADVPIEYQPTARLPQRQLNRRLGASQPGSRRDFLWGLLAGGAATVGMLWIVNGLRRGDDGGGVQRPAGGDNGAGNQGNQGGSNSGTPSASNSGTKIATASSVAANSSVSFTIPSNGDPGILVHLNNGSFVAYDATCTHAGCPVDYDPNSQHLLCPCHGAEFDPARDAAVLAGPADTPLTKVAIRVDSATGAITLA